MTASTDSGPTALCAHSMDIMATGSREDFQRVFHPEAVLQPHFVMRPGVVVEPAEASLSRVG